MAMISGDNGIFGCADGGMVLHRPDRMRDEATLFVASRDFEDRRLRLKLNMESMRWELLDSSSQSEASIEL